MSFTEEIIKVIIDKAVIGAMLLAVGYWINKKFEKFKTEQQRIRELEKQKDELELKINLDKRERDLEFIERQIKEFFWPIYLRLEKDNVLWKRVPSLYQSDEALPREANELFENEFILKNHEEIVQVLEKNTFLIDDDDELLQSVLAYIKHVSVYKTIRKIDTIKHLNPIDLNEPFPQNFFPLIKKRLEKLQKRYSQLQTRLKE